MTEQGGKPPRREPGRMGGALTLLLVLAISLIVMKGFQIPDEGGDDKNFANLMVLAHRDDVEKLSIRGDRLVDAKVTLDRKELVWDSIPVPDYATEQLLELEALVAREFTEGISVADALEGLNAGTWTMLGGYTISDPPAGKSGVFVNYAFGRRMYWAHLAGNPSDTAVDELQRLSAEQGVTLMPATDSFASKVRFEPDNDIWGGLLITLVPWVLFIGFLMFLFTRQMRNSGGGGGIMSFGRSKVKMIPPDQATTTFDQVAGAEEAKEEVQEIISFLKDPKRFSRLGGRVPRGVLLVGSPGTGKTLLAKAIAGEASVPFFAISGSDFVEMFVGVGASRVRDLFKQARENAPCVIFLDEIDAVGRKRGAGLGGGHDEREQTLNQLLVEMDGFDTSEGVILLAATNRPDVLDAALMRPGRFDRQITLDLPDIRGREAILVVHSQKVVLGEDVDLSALARGTPMFSGAELEAVMNEAALIATLHDKDAIEQEDLEEARDKVRFGRQKKSRVVIEEDRRVTAYHEAGHAIVASKLPELVEPVHKVTIIPRGMAMGSTMQLPERDKYTHRKTELKGMLAMLYGGRLAEELFCEDISGGASNDIERATEIARQMVCSWGMSDVMGPVCYGEKRGEVFLGDELMRSRNYSEETSRAIDAEVRSILDQAYQTAREILEGNRDAMERMTEALMRYETISGDDVRAVLAGATVDELRPLAPETETDEPPQGEPDAPAPRHTLRPADNDDDDTLPGTVPLPGPA